MPALSPLRASGGFRQTAKLSRTACRLARQNFSRRRRSPAAAASKSAALSRSGSGISSSRGPKRKSKKPMGFPKNLGNSSASLLTILLRLADRAHRNHGLPDDTDNKSKNVRAQ